MPPSTSNPEGSFPKEEPALPPFSPGNRTGRNEIESATQRIAREYGGSRFGNILNSGRDSSNSNYSVVESAAGTRIQEYANALFEINHRVEQPFDNEQEHEDELNKKLLIGKHLVRTKLVEDLKSLTLVERVSVLRSVLSDMSRLVNEGPLGVDNKIDLLKNNFSMHEIEVVRNEMSDDPRFQLFVDNLVQKTLSTTYFIMGKKDDINHLMDGDSLSTVIVLTSNHYKWSIGAERVSRESPLGDDGIGKGSGYSGKRSEY